MTHDSHKWTQHSFHGTTQTACSACGVNALDKEASAAPCKVGALGDASLPGPTQAVPEIVLSVLPTPQAVPNGTPIAARQNIGPASVSLRDLVAGLNAEAILVRLMEVEGEAAALRVLLEAAEAKEKVQAP